MSIIFNANGGSGSMPPQTGTVGETVPLSLNTFKMANYHFDHWNTLATGLGMSYADGASILIGSSDTTLYAIWAVGNRVLYDGNTADSGSAPVDETFYSNGEQATVLSNSGSLVKAGYVFAGWNTASNGTGENELVGTLYLIGSWGVTLYARWLVLPLVPSTHSVTFDNFRFRRYFIGIPEEGINEVIDETYAIWAGTQCFWASLEPVSQQLKRDLLISFLIAWQLADLYPDQTENAMNNAGMPLMSKESGGVILKFLPVKVQDAMYPLLSNTFGIRALNMIMSAPERFKIRGDIGLYL